MQRRVVVTAAAAITPIGRTQDEIVDALVRGTSGVAPLKPGGFLSGELHARVFGTVGYPIDYAFERRHRKTMGPVAYYACQVAKDVLAAAGLPADFVTSGRMGVAFGSIHGSPSAHRNIYETLLGPLPATPRAEGTPASLSLGTIGAADYLKSMVHTTAASIAAMFGITGRIISSCTACTTASQAIGFGYEAIRFGRQDAMLCGAADEYDTSTVAVFDNLLACSTGYNDRPHMTPRPFDVDRDGLVVGEGAGALLLEDYERARQRDAPILAEILGFACGNNGGDLILPSAVGVRRTLEAALADAELSPDRVDFISAHATATRQGDVVEAEAIRDVYGDRPYVTGFKGAVGHTMSACGALETIFSLYLMQRGLIVPTRNLDQVDPKCAMIRHPRKVLEVPWRTGAVQNFAFGGVNTSLLFGRVE